MMTATCPFCDGTGQVVTPQVLVHLPIEVVTTIIREAAERQGVTPMDVISPHQQPEFCWARDEAAWRMREELGLGLKQIGRYLNRDHSSILTAIGRHAARIAA